jgi:hypothetical protein
MPKIPRSCPACSANLIITQLSCPNCGTQVQGKYQPDLFSRLEPNDFDFVVLFLKTKGNIKEMERELGISYWTIRSKLNEIVAQLGLGEGKAERDELTMRRQAILEQLNQGEISVQEAAARLEELRGRKGKQ